MVFLNPPIAWSKKLESFVKLMSKNSICAGLVSKLHFKMTMMAVDESSDLMGEVAEVAYHLSLHNCRGVVTSLLHLGLTYLLVYLMCSPPWSRNVRSGISRSRQFWIRQLSHLAAWFIWVALWVLYMALKLSLLSTLLTSAGILFQSSIPRERIVTCRRMQGRRGRIASIGLKTLDFNWGSLESCRTAYILVRWIGVWGREGGMGREGVVTVNNKQRNVLVPYSVLLMGGSRAFMLLNRTGWGGMGPEITLRSITKASGRGLGPGNLEFLGPKWHSPNSSMPFHRAQKFSISRAEPPPTCPRNGSAHIKNIMRGPYK
jgi:hypothetical protein